MDTDVIVSKTFPDWFFKQKLVLCFMYDDALSTAFFMAEKRSPVIKKLMDMYENMENNYDVPNNSLLTEFVRTEFPNFLFNGKKQCLSDGVWVFPKTYFDSPTPLPLGKGGFSKHMFMASWMTKGRSRLRNAILKIRLLLPLMDWGFQTLGRKRMIARTEFYKYYLRDKKIP